MTEYPIYSGPVFYFTESVYEAAGKALVGKKPNTDEVQLIFQCVLINPRFRKRIGTHLTFTTDQILESVKGEEYACEFTGLIQLGSNFAYPDECGHIHGTKNYKLIQCAINKDGDIKGKVKVVVGDYESEQSIKKIIEDGNYPLEPITIKAALEEISTIQKELKKRFPN